MSVGLSVGPSTRWFPDDNSRTLGARIMKLHRYIDHDSQMTPIDLEVTRSKVKVTPKDRREQGQFKILQKRASKFTSELRDLKK
ncbi:hypothetical protein DPMN_064750 [Dreissena polymorpha]|uniref:Uncharacterized protein n=1 Tax=Dreissena polymorpha TaxID=45954 RepID=A0A9D4HLE6_DREPO|nr:hypothetical protein DPMN_064750 [Dreissena polymorpha]